MKYLVLNHLIETDASIAAYDEAGVGSAALHEAAVNSHLEIAKFLVEQGATLDRKDRYGLTPLFSCAFGTGTERLEYLFSQGCDLAARDSSGSTIYHLAAFCGIIQVLKYLSRMLPDTAAMLR